MHPLLFVLLLVRNARARPTPEFAGIGPWEGEFFGADPGQDNRFGVGPMMGGRKPLGNPYGNPLGNPYVANPYAAPITVDQFGNPIQIAHVDQFGNPVQVVQVDQFGNIVPYVGTIANPDAIAGNPYGVGNVSPEDLLQAATASDFVVVEPEPELAPPPEPIDLMSASKEKLAEVIPAKAPPKAKKPKKEKEVVEEVVEEEKPDEKIDILDIDDDDEEEEDEEEEVKPFDFMGGRKERWGIAGQGKYIDSAKGDHKFTAGAEWDRGDRRQKYGRFGSLGGFLEPEEPKTKPKKVKEPEPEPEEVEEEVEVVVEEPEPEPEVPVEMPDLPEVEVTEDPEHPLKYNVNIGGIKTGPDDETGPSDFHVFTDETTLKLSSDDMNPETEKYIFEKMMPKLTGERRKKGGNGGGNIFSVFGDDA
jgi:hypothetical protein